ncbi:MAG: hypothetical protein WAZ45_09345 [Gemmiger qucibialis]
MDVQEVWALLEQHQGEQFYTAKCLPFCYIIRGGGPAKDCDPPGSGGGHHRPQKDWLLWCQLLIPDVLNLGIIPQPETGKEILDNQRTFSAVPGRFLPGTGFFTKNRRIKFNIKS